MDGIIAFKLNANDWRRNRIARNQDSGHLLHSVDLQSFSTVLIWPVLRRVFASVGRKEQSLGVARAQVVDPTTLTLARFLDFKVTDYTLTLEPNGTLQARSETLYIDNSGRAQRVRLDTLGKGLEKQWLVSP